jgi:uncharacterized protein YndB with AHSA1/START domain
MTCLQGVAIAQGIAPAQRVAMGHGTTALAEAVSLQERSSVPDAATPFSWRIDGVSTDAQEFHTNERIEDVVAGFRAVWRAEQPGEPVTDIRVGGTRVLGQRVGRSFRVVQFTPDADGTTRVVLSSRELEVARPSAASDVPLAPGSRVIRRLEMARGPRPVVQVYALAAEPPPLAEARFDAAARRAGWDSLPVAHRQLATGVRAWRRGPDELLVVTTPIDAGTGFLLHLTPRSAATGAP